MVKGISKQVIVVDAPEQELFEQAIFILNQNAPPVTDEVLYREAKRLISTYHLPARWQTGPIWALCGGTVVAVAWMLSAFL